MSSPALTCCVYYRARCNGLVFFFDSSLQRVVEAAQAEARMQRRCVDGGNCVTRFAAEAWSWAVLDKAGEPYAVVDVRRVGRYFVHENPADCFEVVLSLDVQL